MPTNLKQLLTILLLSWAGILSAQSGEQQALEAKKRRLQQERAQINKLLANTKKEKGNVLEQVEGLDQKINVSQELIRVTNQQSNLLNRQINTNIRKISRLREELNVLKNDYAEMIQKSYQNKNQQNRLLFLLSSDGFWQAYKRLQYLNQYTKFRKKQGEEIAISAQELIGLNKELVAQRKTKEQLLNQNRVQKDELTKEIAAQKALLATIKVNESKYVAQIEARKREERRIDKEIDRLIRSAIASSNKKTGSSSKTSFTLTPESRALADNFSANKGKLNWPVEKGVKSQGYGVYADKVYPGIKHLNNGVTIATEKGEKVRAIFQGEVMTIYTNRRGIKGVYVRHGDYISFYLNLSEVYVEKGDKIALNEPLGEVYTNPTNNSTKLKFYLYQNTTKLNPEEWIYRL